MGDENQLNPFPQTEEEWTLVDEIIKAFIARHPVDWLEWKKRLEERRAGLWSPKYAELKDRDSRNPLERLAITLPEFQNKKNPELTDSLIVFLKKVFPEILKTKKNLREFMKRFPVFVVGTAESK